ncbi:GNAT family N-acetyltransferase [Streptomyces sp. NPDC059477]|uniref:GNAT family N-acetyltransferase n=1 Tax=Streptomyces sp. NPDC059477 TaxID=3346847 RepID=UPI00369412E0
MPPLTSRVLPAGVLAGSPQPTLPTGDGLLLRPWRDGDVPAVHRAYQDPALHRWHLRAAAGADEVRGWVEDWRAQWAAERGVQFAVADEDSGRLLGRVALRSLALGDGMAEVAYWTVTEARGRRVAARARFTLEGTKRSALLHTDGWHDTHLRARVRGD